MSYDLFLNVGKSFNRRAFAKYFNPRRNYQPRKGQVLYQNTDTGVYFIFDEPQDGMIAFNLNYFRPHVFGLEAAIELEAFTRANNVRVIDAQGDGEEEVFDTKIFVRRWNEGNGFGYRSMLPQMTEEVHTWPAEKIEQIWRWNYARPTEYNETAPDEVFLPGISAIDIDGLLFSVAIWPPQCGVLLPKVDALLIPLAQTGKLSKELALVTWDEIEELVAPHAQADEGLPRYRINNEPWPAGVEAFLNAKREPVGKLNGVSLDSVLDRELVEEARQNPT